MIQAVSILKRPITPPTALGMVDYQIPEHEQLMKRLRPTQSVEEVFFLFIFEVLFASNSLFHYIILYLSVLLSGDIPYGTAPCSMVFRWLAKNSGFHNAPRVCCHEYGLPSISSNCAPWYESYALFFSHYYIEEKISKCWYFSYSAVGCSNGDITLWELGLRERLVTKAFKVWDMSKCSLPFQASVGKESVISVSRVAWSPDGSFLGMPFCQYMVDFFFTEYL